MELAGVTVFTMSAASTLTAAGYANIKPCLAGVFKPKGKKAEDLEPDRREELLVGPMKKEKTEMKLNNSSMGKNTVEFNGEILSVIASDGSLKSTLALGGCTVKVKGTTVTATPPAIPTVELAFANPEEAKKWAAEFNEAAALGPPQERIDHLISTSLMAEKHIKDLRARSAQLSLVEKQNARFKKELGTFKKMGPEDESGGGILHKKSTAQLLSGFFAGGGGAAGAQETQEMNEKLQNQMHSMENAQEEVKRLKRQMVEHVKYQEQAKKWHSIVDSLMLLHKDESAEGQEDPNSINVAPATDIDTCIEPTPNVQQEQSYAGGRADIKQAASESDPGRFGQSVNDITSQYKIPEQRFQEQNVVADRMQNSPQFDVSRVSVAQEQVRSDIVSQVDTIVQTLQRPQLEFWNAVPSNFKSLEERIRSHQLQVNQDCDLLQQALKAQLA